MPPQCEQNELVSKVFSQMPFPQRRSTTGQTALPRFNTAFIQDTDNLNEFMIVLNKRFQALQHLLKEEETTMEDNWKGIKEALTSTCQEVLGRNEQHHKEWFSI
ncbi:unnamed protein product [Schistosoma margrebowiei]|uniref:Uncharacterized protein n=1 Tax=Schistosoma margrebowiei TaxID=48269 RepID=A0A183MT90_9TREM|nr:unnamed protein product [Schistosoma margrebowiei]